MTVTIKPHKRFGVLKKVDVVSIKARQQVSSVHVHIWFCYIQFSIEIQFSYFRDFGAALVGLGVVHQMKDVPEIALPISVVFKEAVTVVDIWRARVSL